MKLLRLLLWPTGVVAGLAAEGVATSWRSPHEWVPDLATGWVLIGCGLIMWSRQGPKRSGVLLATAGFAWFVPNFAASDSAWVAWVAGHALYLHRGPLVQLFVTYPTGRSRQRLQLVAVTVGWVAALVSGVWADNVAAVVLAAALVGVAALQWRLAAGRERRDRVVAGCAAAAFSLTVGLTAAVRLVEPDVAQEWTLLAYELTLCGIAVGLTIDLVRARAETAVTDLVVELSERPSDVHEIALGRALGDPSLELGFWLDHEQAYFHSDGSRIELASTDPSRAVTRVDRDGARVAVLVHDPAVHAEPVLLDAVEASARLAAANARLHAEVREQAAAVEASRLRLLRARDEERRQLELRLRDGAERRLVKLQPVLVAARCGSGPETVKRIDRATQRLEATLADLRELAAGLHPRAISEHGLEQALRRLAEHSPTPVAVRLSLVPIALEIETAIYFVCSEALANVTKYAAAATVELEVTVRHDVVLVEVRDDGVGGADPAAGTGLAGLADRVSALGGVLRVHSMVGSGTRLRAELPRSPINA